MSDDSDDGCDPELTLSPETLLALKDFAVHQGLAVVGDETEDVVSVVQKHFDIHDRDELFPVRFEDSSRKIEFELKGVKRELGQTLSSTGLTIWRAAEHLCDWIFKNTPGYFDSKSVCELGAGLGMVSILLGKLSSPALIVATDGDNDTVELLSSNTMETDSKITTEKLFWGEHDDFMLKYSAGFDIVLAADVIYEKEQILPLITTVSAILKRDRGEFILAFARRNVPIDLVFEAAAAAGLEWVILDEDRATSEHIYIFKWR